MRTVPFSQVLQMASMLYTGETTPDSVNAGLLTARINIRAQEFWEKFFFPEWTIVENKARQFYPSWNAAVATVAGNFYYYPPTQTYYQAMAATTNVPPADVNGDVQWQWWAVAEGDYDGLSLWESTAVYEQGSQIIFANDQNPYQALQTTTAGTDPTNTAYWGLLIPFNRTLQLADPAYTAMGEIRRIWDKNPDIRPEAQEIAWWNRGSYAVVRGRVPTVFPEFRLLPPTWCGPVWSATATYSAGTEIYYSTGFYTATANTNAGESPASTPSKWAMVPFPYVLWKAVAQAAYADVLGKPDGEKEAEQPELMEAYRLLDAEFDKIERQQGQTRPLSVVNAWNANAYSG